MNIKITMDSAIYYIFDADATYSKFSKSIKINRSKFLGSNSDYCMFTNPRGFTRHRTPSRFPNQRCSSPFARRSRGFAVALQQFVRAALPEIRCGTNNIDRMPIQISHSSRPPVHVSITTISTGDNLAL